MANGDLNWITNYIWGIADDVLRDLYVRGKYRDVILPMTVLRRLDSLLEPTKKAVLEMKTALDKAGIANQDQALRQAAGQAFYNTSQFTLRDLKARASHQQLKADFEAYLDGFSPNVQEILENFEFRNQIPRLSKADALGTLIERLLSPDFNLSPNSVFHGDGSVKYPGLDNHAMGTIFEELVRRFNEENNEEAGEHWTPRDAVRLMARLIFLPIANQIESGTYLLYDGACGTGGMLTVAEDTLQQLAKEHGKQVATHLYGQEINAETYAIAKADLLLTGEGDAADNLVGGPEHSTLSNDAFPAREFDFMLSNPPYGKSWKSDLERMGGKGGIKDPRFVIEHAGDPEFSLLTRSSDGQLLFLANMLSKMKHKTPLGSRIAEVHNGSSLFTGDAGQGESNIRRWIIGNDWLEAIVALPLNMFYNTGIATYIWVLSNRKPAHRKGKVQLIDASQWFKPLRKNLGKKNCELSDDDISRICDTYLAFTETEQSKLFPNHAFGYWKVTVERPLRLKGIDPDHAYTPKEIKALKETAARDDAAPPIIKKIHKRGATPDPLHGLFAATISGKPAVKPAVDENEGGAGHDCASRGWSACLERIGPLSLPQPRQEIAAIVSVIDTASNMVVATVGVGSSPVGVAVTPDGKHAYVTNQTPGTVSVIDTATNPPSVVATVPAGNTPFGVAITPDGKYAYVTNAVTSNSVSVIDTTSNMVVGTPIPVGVQPYAVGIVPTPACVPFLAFSALLEIDLDHKPKKDAFALESSFTLGSTASIDPVTEAVTLQVGTFTTTIPPGSFKKFGNRFFTFAGVIGGVRLEALIRRRARSASRLWRRRRTPTWPGLSTRCR